MSKLGGYPNLRLMLPAVLGIIIAITTLTSTPMLLNKQKKYYEMNESKLTKLWKDEGMHDMAVPWSIMACDKFKGEFTKSCSFFLFNFILIIVVAILTDKKFHEGIDICEIAEVGSIILVYVIWKDVYIRNILKSAFTFAGSIIIGILAAFYFITRKRMNWKVQIICIFLLLTFLNMHIATLIFTRENVINSDDTIIENYKGPYMSEELKERIIKICADGGISKNNIFVRNKLKVNAEASSGLFHKTIHIYTGILIATNDEMLIACIYHEIGHIVKHHCIKATVVSVIITGIWYISLVFIHYKMTVFTNGIAAIALSNIIYDCGSILYKYITNSYTLKLEKEADYYAYSNFSNIKAFCDLQRVLSIYGHKCIFFDHDDYWMVFFNDHPSCYKRLLKAKEYASFTGK
ncbi:STE24 endopeptidase [Pancytospora epiphaga]|nr:STE24 endopeptidase [Pancytospora epiphaga]